MTGSTRRRDQLDLVAGAERFELRGAFVDDQDVDLVEFADPSEVGDAHLGSRVWRTYRCERE
jgi:hypothetical protein